jgi:hypothetical protein
MNRELNKELNLASERFLHEKKNCDEMKGRVRRSVKSNKKCKPN